MTFGFGEPSGHCSTVRTRAWPRGVCRCWTCQRTDCMRFTRQWQICSHARCMCCVSTAIRIWCARGGFVALFSLGATPFSLICACMQCIPPAHVAEQGSQAVKHYYAAMQACNGRARVAQSFTITRPSQNVRQYPSRSVSLVGRRKRALLQALQWGLPQPQAVDADSEKVDVHTTEWLTTSAITSKGQLPLDVQIRVPGTIGAQYQGRIQGFGQVGVGSWYRVGSIGRGIRGVYT